MTPGLRALLSPIQEEKGKPEAHTQTYLSLASGSASLHLIPALDLYTFECANTAYPPTCGRLPSSACRNLAFHTGGLW